MIEITLPLPPDRGNARDGWKRAFAKKKSYFAEARLSLFTRFGPSDSLEAPVQAFNRRRLTATLYLWGKMDPDNLVARLKYPIDMLVRYGLLVDDNEKWLELAMPKQEIDRNNRRLVICLTDLEDS